MAQLETRIEGTQKRIEKINAKIARLNGLIEKKRNKIASGKEENNKYPNGKYWLESEIEWHLDDIRRAGNDLASEEKKLDEYLQKNKLAPVVQTLTTIPQIDEFMKHWQEECQKYYEELSREKEEEHSRKYEVTKENMEEAVDYNSYKSTYSKKWSDSEIALTMEKIEKGIMETWKLDAIASAIKSYKYKTWRESHTQSDLIVIEKYYTKVMLSKFLAKEADSRKRALIMKVEKITGKITDVFNLHFGYTTGIEGIIIGESGKAKIDTIYAGGYNIQCLHYRTLVNEIKGGK